mmetsp:Transcript_16154/g.41188  ORF Transcript_16154/g.41188 Transcript_16154/m.41188 type:complete len:92 (-) Transcript_16154:327-602(-)
MAVTPSQGGLGAAAVTEVFAEAVAEIVLAHAPEVERERIEAFTASALAACARYKHEASKNAARHSRFRTEFGDTMIDLWTDDQLGEARPAE